ncbi:hypothetical protein NP233_g346 [Leucocoprinus birnbaumii]|uniref:RRM domain-containing protein n=1 Tax=Leucocoprinus birnbaumii TaxID=56174 RepID=A0AAD5YYP3_9AGAR|nr:hypothetical protein NP233_g346 [Leucocoprinus birnbaumii]
MEPTVTKRLHISGLTPSISQQDLTQRLSTFGNVKSLDGVGALDAVSRPRKFAYATFEATPAKLSRCPHSSSDFLFIRAHGLTGLNSLSGSTWKGAKLRIGEAKPDFRERIQAENEKYAALEPPRKKARWKFAPYHATHAPDMTPVTLEKAKNKGGWVVTPLGRVYRPLKMRPLRPLPRLASATSHLRRDVKGKGKEVPGRGPLKEKKRIKKPDIRARRRKIDMVKYGSEYLKGKFLEADVPAGVGTSLVAQRPLVYHNEESSGDESGEDPDEKMVEDTAELEAGDDESGEEEAEEKSLEPEAIPRQNTVIPASIPPPIPEPKSKPAPPSIPSSLDGIDLSQEKNQSLNLLASLFGSSSLNDNDEDDWIGKESLDSDVDEAVAKQTRSQVGTGLDGNADFEIVPRNDKKKQHIAEHNQAADEETVDVEMGDAHEDSRVKEPHVKEAQVSKASTPAPAVPRKLKDLFAPAENEGMRTSRLVLSTMDLTHYLNHFIGGFSLLGHLNLDDDLELDEDVPFPTVQETEEPSLETQALEHQTITVPTTVPSAKADSRQARQLSQITLDPSQPLFFPLALLATHPAAADVSWITNFDAKNRPKDLFDTAQSKGWDWRSSRFYRTETEDEIRQRWEEQKGELTQGWKKRWREAGRLGRRRGKVGGGEDA